MSLHESATRLTSNFGCVSVHEPSLVVQVFEGSSPVRVCLETSLPRTFEMEADSVVDALGWRESLGAAMNRYDTANKAMAAKHAGDVRVPSGGGCSCHAGISVVVCLRGSRGTIFFRPTRLPLCSFDAVGVSGVPDRHGRETA